MNAINKGIKDYLKFKTNKQTNKNLPTCCRITSYFQLKCGSFNGGSIKGSLGD